MSLERAVAVSLVPGLSRLHRMSRLRAGEPALARLANNVLPEARALLAAAGAAGITALAWDDPAFPPLLRAIPDCPPVLWCRGDRDALLAPAVAVVGSRAASQTALQVSARLGEHLAAFGVVVVSGLARGIDSAAHRGALRAGRTIGVLGSGPDRIYPAEHAGLAREMLARGMVVSEYPPGTPPRPFRFPERNRLISGLSLAVVVVEASERSGSLITVARASEQGREVMAVPGSVLGGRNRGAHGLIRDGAKIVETADDIVEELRLRPPGGDGVEASASHCRNEACVDPLLTTMLLGEPVTLDALVDRTGVAGARLLVRLLDLELRGLVQRLPGGGFVRSS